MFYHCATPPSYISCYLQDIGKWVLTRLQKNNVWDEWMYGGMESIPGGSLRGRFV